MEVTAPATKADLFACVHPYQQPPSVETGVVHLQCALRAQSGAGPLLCNTSVKDRAGAAAAMMAIPARRLNGR
jgi:hypothetical protein